MNRLYSWIKGLKTSRKAGFTVVLGLLLTVAIGPGQLLAQADMLIPWFTTGSGGGSAVSDGYQIQGTTGQAVAVAPAVGGDYQLQGGFWQESESAVLITPDPPTSTPEPPTPAPPTATPNPLTPTPDSPTSTPEPPSGESSFLFLPIVVR